MTTDTPLDLSPCPFCGMTADISDGDTLYPSSIYWRDEPGIGTTYWGCSDRKEGDGQVWAMHCPVTAGGCGAQVDGHTREEAIIKWNRRQPLAALRTEVERLRNGGCARDQRTTQWCAEASRLAAEKEADALVMITATEALRTQLAEREEAGYARGIRDLVRARHEAAKTDAEVVALRAERDALAKVVCGIGNAKRFDREVFADDAEFADWAQSLCGHYARNNAKVTP